MCDTNVGHVVRSKVFKCDIRDAKRSFYRSANEIFGKIGRFAPEDVTLQLIQSKCVPALFYGLDDLPLNKREINSSDFEINQFFMKLFCTSDLNIVRECQQMFQFKIPIEQLAQRRDKFMYSFHSVCHHHHHYIRLMSD